MRTEDWHEPTAVLLSGGIDSAVLLGEVARSCPRVVPVFVRFGLNWEVCEEAAVRRYAAALGRENIESLRVFDMPLRSVYGSHWSTTGESVPDYDSPDEAVFLPGRNVLLLAQPVIWCHLNGVRNVALGTLKGNPFPDSTTAFVQDLERLLNRALSATIRIVRPYHELTKRDVLRRGAPFPLGETWSCIRPIANQQCGQCNKCAERQRGFADAGLPDPTVYAHSP